MASRKSVATPATKKTNPVRTATGKKASPAKLAKAEQASREAFRERTEEGHLKAGRRPPSLGTGARHVGATKVVDGAMIDQSIRDYLPLPITEDEKLLRGVAENGAF